MYLTPWLCMTQKLVKSHNFWLIPWSTEMFYRKGCEEQLHVFGIRKSWNDILPFLEVAAHINAYLNLKDFKNHWSKLMWLEGVFIIVTSVEYDKVWWLKRPGKVKSLKQGDLHPICAYLCTQSVCACDTIDSKSRKFSSYYCLRVSVVSCRTGMTLGYSIIFHFWVEFRRSQECWYSRSVYFPWVRLRSKYCRILYLWSNMTLQHRTSPSGKLLLNLWAIFINQWHMMKTSPCLIWQQLS